MLNDTMKTFKHWPSFKKRFLSNFPKDCFLPENKDICWEWQGNKSWQGYGNITWCNDLYKAHQIAYLIFKGNIPQDKVVRHTCDNPKCVNPKHLILGSHSDNSIDMVKRNHQGSQKLNSEAVKVIKWLLKYKYKRGLVIKLAKLHNVSRQHISEIKKGNKWAWVKV